MKLNPIVENLPKYPMEELAKIRRHLISENKKYYDFGTGDPKLETPIFIREALKNSIPEISQYPSISGNPNLIAAIKSYIEKNHNPISEDFETLPTSGSKEAIFHAALCIVGRNNKRTVAYPNPGYPVYKSSVLFANGTPYPYTLCEENDYEMRPWEFPKKVIEDLCAVWINYPHNPTGKMVSKAYLQKLIDWCASNDVLLLSDECYIDIYDSKHTEKPISICELTDKNYMIFMSLSKRSGITGYRSGFILSDKNIISQLRRARANFGVGSPTFVQAAAEQAWLDEEHVQERREIFAERLDVAFKGLKETGLIDSRPIATFYLWCKTPNNMDDVDFCLGLAKHGVIASPSQWLSEGLKGYFRLAMVPTKDQIEEAIKVIKNYLK